MKKLHVFSLLAFFMLIAASLPRAQAQSVLPQQDGQYECDFGATSFSCSLIVSPSPVPETETAQPTDTATNPPPSPTVQPATPTQTQSGAIAPFANAPECLTHDATSYHSLWDSVRGCHYDHEHGDDPKLGDKYFGTAGMLWGGQTVAYPFTSSPVENVYGHPGKHQGFKWVVRTPEFRPLPACGRSEQNDVLINRSDFCIIAVRAELHVIAGLMDIATRFHSGFVEVYACRPPYSVPNDCGTFKMGSSLIDWGQPRSPFYQTYRPRPVSNYDQPTFSIDFGDGMVMQYKTDTSDFPERSGQPYINVQQYSPSALAFYRGLVPTSNDQFIIEQWSSNDYDCEPRLAGEPCHNPFFHLLYIVDDAPNLLDLQDIRNVHVICEAGKPCHYNGTLTGLNEIGVRVLPAWDSMDGVIDGFVTWQGYTDRFGNPRTDNVCITASPDCVPFALIHAPVGVGQKSSGVNCLCQSFEHDYYFNGLPSGWAEFPN